jgi:hypothetical protein
MGEAKRRAKLGLPSVAPRFARGIAPPASPVRIEDPLVIMFADETGNVHCHLHPSEKCPSPAEYGLLIADLARHVARAFDIPEDEGSGLGGQGTPSSDDGDNQSIVSEARSRWFGRYA